MPTRYRLVGKRAGLLLPFAEHKLRHMRRYAVPNDAYKTGDYRVIIKHDPYSGIDLIDIRWSGGIGFFVGETASRWSPTSDVNLVYYFRVDIKKREKHYVFGHTFTWTGPTHTTKWHPLQSANNFAGNKVDLCFHGGIDYVHALAEDKFLTRQAPSSGIAHSWHWSYTHKGFTPLYPVFLRPHPNFDDDPSNLKPPYRVPIFPAEKDLTAFGNTHHLMIGYGVVQGSKLWGFAVAHFPILGTPNIGNVNGWKDNHTGKAYIVYRELTDGDLDEANYEDNDGDWTVTDVIAEWTEDRDRWGISVGRTRFEEFISPYNVAVGSSSPYVQDQCPCWTYKAVYMLSRSVSYNDPGVGAGDPCYYRIRRFPYALEDDDVNKQLTTELEWQLDYERTGSSDTEKRMEALSNTVTWGTSPDIGAKGTTHWPGRIHAFLHDHTNSHDVMGFVTADGDAYTLWVCLEDNVLDQNGNVVVFRGFSNVWELHTIDFASLYPTLGPTHAGRPMGAPKFWLIDKKMSVVNGVFVDKSKYGFIGGSTPTAAYDAGNFPMIFGVYDAETETFTVKHSITQTDFGGGFAAGMHRHWAFKNWIAVVQTDDVSVEDGTTTYFFDILEDDPVEIIYYDDFTDVSTEGLKPSEFDTPPIWESSVGGIGFGTGSIHHHGWQQNSF